MSYAVKSIFHTLQGEGTHAGRAATFVRFSRCNLWSGREADRANAVCQFCDTDFVGTDGPLGAVYPDAATLAATVTSTWNEGTSGAREHRFVVCTGGEPLLQLDAPLLDALHADGFEIAIETNGTLPVPDGVDWVCVSPKAGADLVVTSGDELKLVYPQPGAEPEQFEHLAFDRFLLSPMDVDDPALARANATAAATWCRAHPRWRLSVQTHKSVGFP